MFRICELALGRLLGLVPQARNSSKPPNTGFIFLSWEIGHNPCPPDIVYVCGDKRSNNTLRARALSSRRPEGHFRQAAEASPVHIHPPRAARRCPDSRAHRWLGCPTARPKSQVPEWPAFPCWSFHSKTHLSGFLSMVLLSDGSRRQRPCISWCCR